MSEENVTVVRGVYDAFGRGDIPAILGALDADVDWRVPETLPHGGAFRGRDGVQQFFGGIGEKWDGLAVDIEDTVSDGDRVVVVTDIRGGLRATGEDTGYRAAHVWTVRGGTLVAFAEYVDAPPGLPAAGS